MADLIDVMNDLVKRVYDLERAQQRGAETLMVVGTAVAMGIPTAGQVTNSCRLKRPATLVEAHLEVPADTPATSDLTWDILKTGSSIGSVTLSTGADEGRASIGVGFTAGDQIQVQATTPGDGYASATLHLLFDRTDPTFHPPVLLFTPPTGGGGGGDYTVTWPISGTVDLNQGSNPGDTFLVPTGGGGTITSVEYVAVTDGGGGQLALKLNGTGVDFATMFAGPQDVTHTSADFGTLTVADGDTFFPYIPGGQDTFSNFGTSVTVTVTGASVSPGNQNVNWTP